MATPAPQTARSARLAATLAACGVGLAAELALLAQLPGALRGFPSALVTGGFTAGPLLLLALMAWRRRARPARLRVVFPLALLVAAVGVGGFAYLVFGPQPRFGNPGVNPVLVPLVQWLGVLAVWAWFGVAEGREKRAEAAAGS